MNKEQGMGAKNSNTLALLKKKKPVTRKVEVVVVDEEGETAEISLTFQSIGSTAYDDLVAKYPPTPKQKEQGLTYNMEKFAPALVAACCMEPEMTLEDAKEIWSSDAWNRGELMALFLAAVDVNTRGHDLPPTESD